MLRYLAGTLFAAVLLCAAPRTITSFSIQEDGGLAREKVLVEQGVPVPPLQRSELPRLAVVDESGAPVVAGIEENGTDPQKRVRWLRVSLALKMAPWARRTYRLVADAAPATPPALRVGNQEGITVEGPGFRASFSGPAHMEMSAGAARIFSGDVQCQIYPDARSIINAGGKTTVLSGFVPAGWRIERPSPVRAVMILSGRYPKQRSYSSGPGQLDPKLGFDVELRFHFSALSRTIGYDWRLINRAGYKSWLERYAIILPLVPGAKWIEGDGPWMDLETAGQHWGITSPFSKDFGVGTGARLEPGGLAIGGLAVPPDGSLGGEIPQIHRWFHYGMSRTFAGRIVIGEGARTAHPLHMRLPGQYYSDLNLLPERGDKLTDGEFADAVERSSRWLLANQWRGTLWAGEWWREWDIARHQGTEETSSANSPLGPLNHYFRTGDKRFLESAALSAWYVYDIQEDKKQTGFGPMLHTRRHLLDELNWIHPRYQRAAGSILASHVLLADRERQELIATVRHFSEQIQDAEGVPHDWDEAANRRSGETGVDTTNFVEALMTCWIETGDSFFLDRARGYTRWALAKFRTRTDDSKWNWNLTRYVLTGVLAICHAANEYPGSVPEKRDFLEGTIAISRNTLDHPEYAFVPGTLGEGGLHYIFYHGGLDAQVSRLANDPSMLQPLLKIIRSQIVRQDSTGAFPIDVGSLWSQYPTRIISSYDAKSVVEYLPALSARLAATGQAR